ncbi:MAG: Ferric transporter ATP-binding subunit, partial [Dehalococcoidia bacterium]|nr:Ferric transporter ATP-binding subunit [Dehalococcoidia bacterium]
ACAVPKATPAPASLPAPASSPTPTLSEWDKVLDAARKEGTLTLYTTWAAQLGESARAAMKDYGITLETVGGRGGDLELKIRTEQRAAANVADLLLTGWTNAISIADAGLVQAPAVALPSLAEKDVWKVHPRQHGPDGVFVLGRGINLTTVINTDLVKKGEITSWNDLLDPKWRDKMVMTDPRPGSGPGASGLGTWITFGSAHNHTRQLRPGSR